MFTHYSRFILLLSVFAIGCSEDDTATPLNPSSELNQVLNQEPFADAMPEFSGSNVNGNLTGEIWIADSYLGTERFNLQTGKQSKISEHQAFASKDGSEYLEYIEEFDDVFDFDCDGEIVDIHKISVKHTSSETEISSFLLDRSVRGPFLISPDGERVAMEVAEYGEDCGANTFNEQLTVFTRNGDELFRGDESIVSFDWHPDGRLVTLVFLGDLKYEIHIETTLGTLEFIPLVAFERPPEILSYTGLNIGPTGSDALLEGITDRADEFAGYAWRAAKVYQFNLFEPTPDPNLFVYASDDVRVNTPIYSPDGQFLLVTEGFAEGDFVNYTSLPDLDVIENLLLVPVSEASTSYVVPVNARKHSMPPIIYTEKVRPVFSYNDESDEDTFSSVGFNPINGLSWIPAVD